MTEKSCLELFQKVQLEVLELFRTQDVSEGRVGEMWVNIIGKCSNKTGKQ